ncbi:MAG: hypothetical protein LBI63_02410 [Candidatus Ancillula sp.]|nr:hypothetical protein [Candidatus Ancillula sp.]
MRTIGLVAIFLASFVIIVGNTSNDKSYAFEVGGRDVTDVWHEWIEAMPGNGTEDDPKIINTLDDLVKIQIMVNNSHEGFLASAIFGESYVEEGTGIVHLPNDANVYLALGADIDLSPLNGQRIDMLNEPKYCWDPIGTKGYPFMAHFDGRDHSIENLKIAENPEISDERAKSFTAQRYLGLFGVTNHAEIKNIKLLNVISVQGISSIGALVGEAQYTDISNVATNYSSRNDNAEIRSVSGQENVGGLIGHLAHSNITKCSSFLSVNGVKSTGGLVGLTESANIFGSYSKGRVYGDDLVGGLVGANTEKSAIKNSYAEGDVYGRINVGGISGSNIVSKIENSLALNRHILSTENINDTQFFGVITGTSVENLYAIQECIRMVAGVPSIEGTGMEKFDMENLTIENALKNNYAFENVIISKNKCFGFLYSKHDNIDGAKMKNEDLRPGWVTERRTNWEPWRTEDGWMLLDEIFPPIHS